MSRSVDQERLCCIASGISRRAALFLFERLVWNLRGGSAFVRQVKIVGYLERTSPMLPCNRSICPDEARLPNN